MKKLVTTTTVVDLVDDALMPDGESVNYTAELREVFGFVNDMESAIEDTANKLETYETLALDTSDVGKADRERMSDAISDVSHALSELHECLMETGSHVQGALDVFEGLGAEVAYASELLDMGEDAHE